MLGAMQDELNDVCQNITAKVSPDDLGNATFTLTKLLTALRPRKSDDVKETVEYISARQAQQPELTYEATLMAQFAEIRSVAESVTGTARKNTLMCTGKITASHCMCLYVCGLLQPPGVDFLSLLHDDQQKAYADAFFDEMIRFVGQKKEITVIETKFEERVDAKFAFKPLFAGQPLETDEVTAACFVCAEKEAAVHMSHEDTVILDAFSSVGQFIHYDPVVWYAYCLWAFASVGIKELACYGVKTDSKVFIFIGNYADHVDFVHTQGLDATAAVRELVTQPLGLYRNCLKLMQLDKNPKAVISRSWHAIIQPYVPLAYVHLLLLPSCPFYADVAYNTLLPGILAFAVGQTRQGITEKLVYQPTETTPIEHTNSGVSLLEAYKRLGQAHYDLMMAHKFVIPTTATQDEILFDAIEAGTPVQHQDHIAALCHVRYNWVFDPAYAPIWAPAQALSPGAPYHQIDVHRHITHLQTKPGIPNDLTKRLSTGFYVTDSKRKGVIIFDVQAHGRAENLFLGRHASRTCDITLREFAGARFTQTDKTKRSKLYGALKRYFDVPDHTQWSLCDMAYKYLVLEDETDKIFVQDSYALTHNEATPPSVSRCIVCPVCFKDPTLALDGTNSMLAHIQEEHKFTYYMADFPVAAPDFSVHTPLEMSPAGSTTASAAVSVAAGGSAGSGSVPSVPGSSASSASGTSYDPAAPSHNASTASNTSTDDAAFEEARNTRNEHTDKQVTELTTEITKPQTASDAQSHLSQANFERLTAELAKERADRAQDTAEKDALIQVLNDNIQTMTDAIKAQTATLDLETTTKTELEDKLKELKDKHAEAVTKHEEAVKQHEEDKKKHEEENKEHEDELARLDTTHKLDVIDQLRPVQQENDALIKAQEALKQNIADLEVNNKSVVDLLRQLAEKNAEIEALNKRVLDLEAELAVLQATAAHSTTSGDAQLQALQDALDQANDDLAASQAEVATAAVESDLSHAENTRLQNKIQTRDTRIDELLADLAAANAGLDAAVATKRSTLKHIQDTISANVQQQIALADLAPKLELEDYHAIRDAVLAGAGDPTRTKRLYSDSALFLILESMGGTWCMYLKLVRGQKPPPQAIAIFDAAYTARLKTYTENLELILRQMLYDLTMWYSIENAPKKTRYSTRHLHEFIQKFGLENKELHNSTTPSSDDDGADADAEADDEERLDLVQDSLDMPPVARTPRNKIVAPSIPNGRKPNPPPPRDNTQKPADPQDAMAQAIQDQYKMKAQLVEENGNVVATPRPQDRTDYGDQTPRPNDTLQPVAPL